jgi:hypothetical protein
MSKLKPQRASKRLVQHRDRPGQERAVSVSGAASALARRLVRKRGKGYMTDLAGRGGTAAWAGMSYEERVIEMRRRARKRELNRRKKIAAQIAAGLDKYR